MRRLAMVLALLVALLPRPGATMAQDTNAGRPPVANKVPKTIAVHGETLVDDYFWLREKTNPASWALGNNTFQK